LQVRQTPARSDRRAGSPAIRHEAIRQGCEPTMHRRIGSRQSAQTPRSGLDCDADTGLLAAGAGPGPSSPSQTPGSLWAERAARARRSKRCLVIAPGAPKRSCTPRRTGAREPGRGPIEACRAKGGQGSLRSTPEANKGGREEEKRLRDLAGNPAKAAQRSKHPRRLADDATRPTTAPGSRKYRLRARKFPGTVKKVTPERHAVVSVRGCESVGFWAYRPREIRRVSWSCHYVQRGVT
jgi:hypothetical protein